ncbi:MAG: LysR family transcriptional regulator [Bdellovibrionota bacterium]
MDLKLIQSFLSFAGSSNIVEASKKLGISQPALSDHLRRFEDALPEKVFLQKGRRKTLTLYGSELYKALDAKFSGIEEIISGAGKSHVSESKAKLTIAGRKEILKRLAVQPTKFKGHLIFIESEGAKVTSQLTNGQADIVLSALPPDGTTFMAKPLFTYSFQILTPKGWGYSSNFLNRTFLSELIERPFLSYQTSFSPLVNLLEKFALTSEPREVVRFDDWSVLIKLVEQGKGWTLVPTGFEIDERKVQHHQLPKELRQENRFFLVFYKEQYQIPWFKEVVQDMLSTFKTV